MTVKAIIHFPRKRYKGVEKTDGKIMTQAAVASGRQQVATLTRDSLRWTFACTARFCV